MNNVVFTICARNYLAQALTLRESILKYNDVDFFIFLADEKNGLDVPDVVELDEEWVPNWRLMAFKYDVVEFSTAIKPYAIQKLFNEEYEKVSYIDPDIYVTNNLDYVWDQLDKYSAILTPHRCTMIRDGEFIDEHGIILNGIYNLGFFAVRNNSIGLSIVTWWIEKLSKYCYLDLWDGLAVDQKWMEFIPAYYPKDVLITSHLGMNVAIWNIQERIISVDTSGSYIVQNRQDTNAKFRLLFWHFSGYSPLAKDLLLKGNPKTAFENYPEIKKLGEEYYCAIMRNEYNVFSKITYSFNYFDNGEVILPIHRRLYRFYYDYFSQNGNPFLSKNSYYKTLKKSKLLSSKDYVVKKDPRRDPTPISHMSFKLFVIYKLLRILKRVIGIDNYVIAIKAFGKFSNLENHFFLIKDNLTE